MSLLISIRPGLGVACRGLALHSFFASFLFAIVWQPWSYALLLFRTDACVREFFIARTHTHIFVDCHIQSLFSSNSFLFAGEGLWYILR